MPWERDCKSWYFTHAHYKSPVIGTGWYDNGAYILPLLRFNPSEDVSGFSQAKSSVIRGIKSRLVDQYPLLSSYIDDIIPKKEPLNIMKWCACGSCDPWPITIDFAWPTLLLSSRTNKRPVIVLCCKICCNQKQLKLLLRCCASEGSSIMVWMSLVHSQFVFCTTALGWAYGVATHYK